jgi:hypothetical protein
LVTLKMPSNLGKDGKGLMKFVEGEIVITWNGGAPATTTAEALGAPTWETETTATAALVLDPSLQKRLASLRATDPAAHMRVMQAATTALAAAHIVVHNPPSLKLAVASSDDLLTAAELTRTRVALPVVAPGSAATSTPLRTPVSPARSGAIRSTVCQQLGPGACNP